MVSVKVGCSSRATFVSSIFRLLVLPGLSVFMSPSCDDSAPSSPLLHCCLMIRHFSPLSAAGVSLISIVSTPASLASPVTSQVTFLASRVYRNVRRFFSSPLIATLMVTWCEPGVWGI